MLLRGYSTHRRRGKLRFKPGIQLHFFLNAVFRLGPLKKKKISVLPYLGIKYCKSWKYFRSAKLALLTFILPTPPKTSLLAFILDNGALGSCCLLPSTPAMLWMKPMSPGWPTWLYSSLGFPHAGGNLFSCFYRTALILLSSTAAFQKGTEHKFSLPYFSSSSH